MANKIGQNTTTRRIHVSGILDVDQRVKRSLAGQALEHLGLVVFSVWMTLATSLLEAGSCGSVDTKNGLRAWGVSWRRRWRKNASCQSS